MLNIGFLPQFRIFIETFHRVPLISETKWECQGCREEERSLPSTFGETWGHLESLECDQCRAECDKDDNCDGIQCVSINKTPIPQINTTVVNGKVRSLSGFRSIEDPIGVGIPCQWLKKPKQSQKCESDARYMTCWKRDSYWSK